ncbi:MAG: hypothetical protein K0S32_3136 [Bacteroidetes bacterium]|jgi:cell division septation protein DedD|nr:hypothetical protein [Bacteroidota bacterium]
MIKYLFILINSLTLFLYSLFSGDGGITITNTIPTSIQPGKTVPVEVRIAKGNMSGFAKMQLELPAGISVNEIDNKGSNFSYVDGIAKWVWASLPTDAEIILKFSLVVDATANGKTIIAGKYSYVENNAKQVVEMAPVEVTLGGDGAVANTNTSSETPVNTNTASSESTANTTTTSTSESTPTNTNSNSEPVGNITVQRSVSKTADGEYTVNLKVSKGATKGFARFSDDLPEGITAKAGKTEGASFSVADGKVKFVWVAVPEKEELELSYTLSGVKSPLTLNGEYSYLEQNQSKKYTLPAETITPEAGNVATNTNTTSSETNTSTAQNTNTTSSENTAQNTNTTSSENTANNTSNNTNTNNSGNETITKKEGNVSYMVQIGAFTNSAVSSSRLSKKFNVSESIRSEFQGGFSKFMVGSHNEYKSARDHREKMRSNNGIMSAFVVAYNTGKRITVQEALMITSQKWFK